MQMAWISIIIIFFYLDNLLHCKKRKVSNKGNYSLRITLLNYSSIKKKIKTKERACRLQVYVGNDGTITLPLYKKKNEIKIKNRTTHLLLTNYKIAFQTQNMAVKQTYNAT